MLLVGIAASAQIYKTEDGFELKVGEYLFHGTCSHGYFKFYSDIEGHTEVDELAAFISRNIYALNEKWGVTIMEVGTVRNPIYEHGVKTPYSRPPCVMLGIATKDYNEYIRKQHKESEERLKSLSNIL